MQDHSSSRVVGYRQVFSEARLGLETFRDAMKNSSSMFLPGFFLLSELNEYQKKKLYLAWIYNFYALVSRQYSLQIITSMLRDIRFGSAISFLCKIPSIVTMFFSRVDVINRFFSIQEMESTLIKNILKKVLRSIRTSPIRHDSEIARSLYFLPSDIKQVLSGQFKNSSSNFIVNIACLLVRDNAGGLLVLLSQVIKVAFLRSSIPNQRPVSSYNQEITSNIRRSIEHNHLGDRQDFNENRVVSASGDLIRQGSSVNNQLIIGSSMEGVAMAILSIMRYKLSNLDSSGLEQRLISDVVNSLYMSSSLSQLTMCGEWLNCSIKRINILQSFISKNTIVDNNFILNFSTNEFICIKGVSYGLSPELHLLNDLSLDFRPGFYQIMGENGAGKSTFFQLISGELRPTCGNILIGGVEAGSLSSRQRDRYITSIHAKPFLITNRSVLFNLMYFLGPSVFDDELVDQAYAHVNFTDLYSKRDVWPIINDCKLIVDYFLGDNNNLWARDTIEGLSAGERKLILLMSLFLRVDKIASTRIILLDEIEANLSVSHLRKATEYVNRHMDKYRDKVVLFISHGSRALFSNDLFRDVTVKKIRLHHGRLEWLDTQVDSLSQRSSAQTSILVDNRSNTELSLTPRRRQLTRATL